MILYTYTYNNYFNRQVKVASTLADYGTPNSVVTAVNFNPGDDINTSQIINDDVVGDYMVAVEDDGTINSRWFIMAADRLRNGQYRLQLHRDLLVDYYDAIINAPVYLQKGTLASNDPMIFNPEPIQVNRIKQSETLLTEDDMGWIVGYTQIPDGGLKADSINLDQSTDYVTVASLDSWDWKDFMTTSIGGKPSKYLAGNLTMWLGGVSGTSIYIVVTDGTHKIYIDGRDYAGNMDNTMEFVNKDSTKNLFATYFDLNNGSYNTTEVDQLDGRIIKESSTGKYYKVHFKFRNLNTHKSKAINADAGALYTELLAAMKADNPNHVVGELTALWYYNEAYMYLEETAVLTGDFKIYDDATFLKKLNDADYCMFAIPCPTQNASNSYANYTYTYQKSMAIAQMLARQLQPSSAGGNLIDLQLLPYCPTKNGVNVKSTLGIYDANGLQVGEVYCCKVSTFDIIIDSQDTQITIGDYKLSSICDTYRLVAPNYSSTYEFSPAKNGGVKYWHINCTYKPYTPYINVHPHWSGLYGQDFDDNRGLILGGDYSLPQTSDAFETYQIQNKNYSTIFDRQLTNMDIKAGWATAEAAVNAVSGTAQGVAQGTLIGGSVGAVVGGVVAAGAGVADIAETVALNKENKSYATDLYNYNLGNIDSRPNTLVKSSAFDISYKMWPFVEYCTCTDTERTAVTNILKYRGMTINRIGTISELLGSDEQFIQCSLIRLTGIDEDAAVVSAINTELQHGIYFGGK